MEQLKEKIDEKLKKTDFQSRKELILWLTKEKEYQRLKAKDNQLMILDLFTAIWVEEKKKMSILGITEDILTGVDSLYLLEKKYREIKYFILRVENHLAECDCKEAMDQVLSWNVTGIALGMIAEKASLCSKRNILEIVQLLKKNKQYMITLLLLQYVVGHWQESDNNEVDLTDFLVIMREMEKVM